MIEQVRDQRRLIYDIKDNFGVVDTVSCMKDALENLSAISENLGDDDRRDLHKLLEHRLGRDTVKKLAEIFGGVRRV